MEGKVQLEMEDGLQCRKTSDSDVRFNREGLDS
jgi:hypothetical protein